jgi:hypothetical protein
LAQELCCKQQRWEDEGKMYAKSAHILLT